MYDKTMHVAAKAAFLAFMTSMLLSGGFVLAPLGLQVALWAGILWSAVFGVLLSAVAGSLYAARAAARLLTDSLPLRPAPQPLPV